MEINASLTLLFNEDGLRIEIRDSDASSILFQGNLTPECSCQALSRLMNVPIEKAEVFNLERAGKKLEHKMFEFFMGGDFHNERDRAVEMIASRCPEGWVPDMGFSSQGSFFRKDEERWARTTIRRWVEQENSDG